MKFLTRAAAAVLALTCALPAFALGQKSFVAFGRAAAASDAGTVALLQSGRAAPLFVDPADHAGVLRAAGDLQADIERVGAVRPALLKDVNARGADVLIIGTVGKSALIDRMVQSGVLDVSAIEGKWEGWQVQTLANPLPGVGRALVIAGSDKRGTIYGIYELSEQIGVSPWYWWADVPPRRRNAIHASAAARISDAPAVQYRGIFLNDEAPALTGWVKQRYGGYNHRFYEKVFELILRLRGNYLWPAMWDAAFYDDDKLNGRRAEEYGIVMGTSHHEPMSRAHKEWERYGKGAWDYGKNAAVLQDFWRGGLRASAGTEQVLTLGMRGDGDEPMSEGANVALLERIVKDQRQIIAEQINPDMAKVPQVWALYKEVQEYYEKGMRVPDDVLLLWCDDNWANIRRLPTPDERKRTGGAGVYYHFDYVGGPRSYKWLNVTPIPKIWEQMRLAWEYDAKRMWIVNVGDLKPMEVPIEFFLTYAWNPQAWPAERLPDYLRLWAAREFGDKHADDIADIVAKYTRYNGRRKPEQLEPGTYSQVHYNESARIVAEYREIAARAEKIAAALPARQRDAFFQLVLYPVKAGAVVNELYAVAGANQLHARQGRASANDLAGRARALFRQDAELARQYQQDIGGGKWNHMMSQTHLGYTYWNQPPRNVMPPVSEVQLPLAGDMGVAVEGSEFAWPGQNGDKLALPELDGAQRQARFIDIFNRGRQPFRYTVTANVPWLALSHIGGTAGGVAGGAPDSGDAVSGAPRIGGTVARGQRIVVDVLWRELPAGATEGTLTVEGPGGKATIRVPVRAAMQAAAGSYVETQGVVAVEAEHYANAVAKEGWQWLRVPDHGRTASAMTTLPASPALAVPGGAQGMRLEYRVHLRTAGQATVHTTLAPTLKFQPGEGFRYAVSFDDEPPQVVDVHADASQGFWEKAVSDGAVVFQTRHHLAAGEHTLKYWAIDPALVLQKVVIDAGGLKPSYLGPPESPTAP